MSAKYISRGTWLAQSVECKALDLRVVSLSPTLGVEITLKNKILKKRSLVLLKDLKLNT